MARSRQRRKPAPPANAPTAARHNDPAASPAAATPAPPPAPAAANDAEAIIACAIQAKAEADEQGRREAAEARRRDAVLTHLLNAWRPPPPTGQPDPAEAGNRVNTLYLILQTAAPLVPGELLDRLPERGDARRVVVAVCRLIRSGDTDRADRRLADALDSTLAPRLWADLCRRFPQDVARLLPVDLCERFKASKPRRRPATQTPAAREAALPPAPAKGERLTFDDPTLTVTLDGEDYRLDDPKTYGVFKTIALAEHPRITNQEIQRKVRGVGGKHAIPDRLKSLPRQLRATVKTTTNGHHVQLPPPRHRKGAS